MFEKITIIGDGGMGSICAMLLCEKGVKTTMWGYDPDQLASFEAAGENVRFLPGHKLPENLLFESRDDKAMASAKLVVSAVPCQFTRRIWQRLKTHVPAGVPIVSVTKGIENSTLLRPSEILTDVLGPGHSIAALSGPTIADEVADEMPATASVASKDAALAKAVQETFTTPHFRVYTNDDIVGVELSGAVKNVIAIAAGVIDGIGAGDNAKAALVSRGLAEIKRLGLAMGAKENTFAGLSGLGDLITTCISPKGRNRSFGERIGKGLTAKEALAATDSVVEGVTTCESVLALAKHHNIEMPITEAIHSVVVEGKCVQTAIHDLMTRQLKAE
ncbi:MAG: NAD(P)H-dependent glycerol-3-phosphate dehydrogenase [Planctomycetota bacterium]|jgi:glycerol-3-phosphate dehydrogenase (NAD(P)+)